LLTNVGSPDAPTPKALRRYLRQFLWDPRVIDLPRFRWWLILNLFVLTTRPRTSAQLYAKIWTDEGSPLLVTAARQAEKLQAKLQEAGDDVLVAIGMGYGSPSIATGLASLRDAGCETIVVFPLFPQYSAATTGSTFDGVAAALRTWRSIPHLKVISGYHDDPAYIEALADSIRVSWERDGKPDKLMLSFHGLPQRYVDAGDPYEEQCRRTTALIVERMGLDDSAWLLTFQSRFGREPWLQPYTDVTLREWGAAGVGRVDVVCPAFSADCLETLEEIDIQYRKVFIDAGGKDFRYIPALNDSVEHIELLYKIMCRA
jgi:ferrochelatase